MLLVLVKVSHLPVCRGRGLEFRLENIVGCTVQGVSGQEGGKGRLGKLNQILNYGSRFSW